MDVCKVDDCVKPRRAGGWCVMHYARFKKYGSTELPTKAERFWAQVDIGEADECWEWQGKSRLPRGYGITRVFGQYLAHRVAFLLANGYAPDPMCCHHCDNPPCCNPAHLYQGDGRTNMADAIRRGRRDVSSPEYRARLKAAAATRKPHRSYFGAGNPNSKLTDEEVAQVRMLHAEGWTQIKIAERFGIKQPHVSRLVRGVLRTEV
jgi:hypothetical protein